MPIEVRGACERPSTRQAPVRSLARVDALVLDEARALSEAPAAHRAEEGLLAGVRALMTEERRQAAEALAAVDALVRLKDNPAQRAVAELGFGVLLFPVSSERPLVIEDPAALAAAVASRGTAPVAMAADVH